MATLNDNITSVNDILKGVKTAINESNVVSVDKPKDYESAIKVLSTYTNKTTDLVTSEDSFISRKTCEGANVVDGSFIKLNSISGNSEVVNGKIVHANIGELVSTGKNLLKDIVTNSTINDKGAILSSQASNTSDYVKVFSNTQYTISGVSLGDTNYRYIGFYDENKKFISNVGLYNTNKVTFTTPTNAMYVIICFKNNAANIQLELGSSATSYTPYIEPTKLSLNLDLPKGYKLTEDGLVKSWGSVDLSTLSWGYEASYPRFIANLSSLKPKLPTNNDTKANMLCSKYTTETLADVIDRSHKVGIALSTGGFISINEPAYTDISTFVNTIQGVILEYELATPITDESIKLPSSNLIAYKGGMEYFTETEIKPTLNSTYAISKLED